MHIRVYFTFTVVNDVMQLMFNVYIVRIPSFFILYSICIHVAIILEVWPAGKMNPTCTEDEEWNGVWLSLFLFSAYLQWAEADRAPWVNNWVLMRSLTSSLGTCRWDHLQHLYYDLVKQWQFYDRFICCMLMLYIFNIIQVLCCAIAMFRYLCFCSWHMALLQFMLLHVNETGFMGSSVFSGGSWGG